MISMTVQCLLPTMSITRVRHNIIFVLGLWVRYAVSIVMLEIIRYIVPSLEVTLQCCMFAERSLYFVQYIAVVKCTVSCQCIHQYIYPKSPCYTMHLLIPSQLTISYLDPNGMTITKSNWFLYS